MPARQPTANPTIMAGTNIISGTPNTGQILTSPGGASVTFTNYSGAVGPDVVIAVGQGRLDSAFFHDSLILALSGQAVTFYDASVAVSGGPLAASNHRVVGVLAPQATQAPTGVSGAFLRGGNVMQFGMPFLSGLVHTTRSGAAGFSVGYTMCVSN